ncbi:MAG: hypothetical protein Q4G46_11255 [Propionibacteriaceae bacterium]|nr:hypothetical protein [Propionibacteriaceae bacterium]
MSADYNDYIDPNEYPTDELTDAEWAAIDAAELAPVIPITTATPEPEPEPQPEVKTAPARKRKGKIDQAGLPPVPAKKPRKVSTVRNAAAVRAEILSSDPDDYAPNLEELFEELHALRLAETNKPRIADEYLATVREEYRLIGLVARPMWLGGIAPIPLGSGKAPAVKDWNHVKNRPDLLDWDEVVDLWVDLPNKHPRVLGVGAVMGPASGGAAQMLEMTELEHDCMHFVPALDAAMEEAGLKELWTRVNPTAYGFKLGPVVGALRPVFVRSLNRTAAGCTSTGG